MMVLLQQVANIRQSVGHHVVNGLTACFRQGLLEPSNSGTGPNPAFASIRLGRSGNDPHESCFTGAVTTQQANSLAFGDLKINFIQQDVCAEVQ